MNEAELRQLMEEKGQLCVGLDLRVNTEEKLERAFQIIEETSEYASVYKPNRQYWLDVPEKNIKELNNKIHQSGAASIIDHKLSDIGSSNEAALKQSKREGFDLITVSPFPGNLQETYMLAKNVDIGIIALVLMSNPEAKWMVNSGVYRDWAEQAKNYADAMVLGTTNHVTREILADIKLVSGEKVVLAPGLGSQGGRIDDLVDIFGKNVLFNVSRGISQSEDYKQSAAKYFSQIRAYRS